MRFPVSSYSTVALVGIAIGAGCLTRLPNHCSELEGDQTCADRGQGRFCACVLENDGCVDEEPSEDCRFPGPSEPSSTSDAEVTSGETTTSSGPSTIGPTDDSPEPMQCASDDECTDAAAPICDPKSSECLPCDAMGISGEACADRDPGTPVCAAGRCVECTPGSPAACVGDRLVCDGGSNTCVACTEHDQCISGACELAHEGGGRCFPPDTLMVHVDGDGGHDHETLYGAVLDVEAALDLQDGEFAVIMVHEREGAVPYSETVRINGGKTIALRAAPDESPMLHGTGGMFGGPALRIEGLGTTLYVEGMELSFTPVHVGVVVDEALAWFDQSRIVQNSGGGVSAVNNAQITVRNCFIGGDVSDVHALEVDGASASVLYTTLGAGFGDAAALACSGQATVHVRNSLLVARTGADEVQCAGAEVEHSAAELDLDGSNVALQAMETSWFEASLGYGAGDFHLSDMHPPAIDTTAEWRAGDPRTDIDGQDRMAEHGARGYAGADAR